MRKCKKGIGKIFIVLLSVCAYAFGQQPQRGVDVIKGERKIALVIGNTNYDPSIGRLKNPVNDAQDTAAVFKRLGFTLIGGKAQLDVNKKQMKELVLEFGRQIKQGGVGVFYFSGHGVQVDRRNYIIPIADSMVYEDEAETEAVEVDAVAKEMEYAGNRLNILILDACRNNALLKRNKGSEKGLTAPTRQPEGTFIAFAAGDGQTASDNTGGRNGLFTQELLKNLETPNARLDDVFRTTRNEVKRLSNGMQVPLLQDSTSEAITLNFVENGSDRPPPPLRPSPTPARPEISAPSDHGKKANKVLFAFGAISGRKVSTEEVFSIDSEFIGLVTSSLKAKGLTVLSINNKDLTNSESNQYFGGINSRDDEKALRLLPVALIFDATIELMEDLPQYQGMFVSRVTGKFEIIDTNNNKSIGPPERFNQVRGFGNTQDQARKNALRSAAEGLSDSFLNLVKEKAR